MLFDVIVDRGGPCPPQKPWSYFNIKSCQWGNHGGSSHAGCCSLHGSPGPYDFRGARDVITYSALTCRYCPFIPRLDFVREYADAGRRLAAESMTPGGRYGRVCAWLQGSAPAVRGVVWF